MHWANWMLLGIIVTLLACMAQSFASSISLTKYAPIASCRHKMAHAWKCRSYLPTYGAISQTSHEKVLLWMRSSMLFWNWGISQRATVPGWCFWGFFNNAAHKNSFQGALAPMVGWSFLQAGSSPPDVDGLASTAIWANCWVGNDSSDLPTCSSHSASSILLFSCSWLEGVSCTGTGGSTSAGGAGSTCTWALVFTFQTCFSFPFFGVPFVLTILKFKWEREKVYQELEQSHKSQVASILKF